MRTLILAFIILLANASQAHAGKKLKVLFLGNSYTDYNTLPQIVADLAKSTGDTLVYDRYNPGGKTLQDHFYDPIAQNKIKVGDWDYVVLQEQSQIPSFPDGQVETQFYQWADRLDDYIKTNSPCATTMFYMTWGRKNGDAQNCMFYPDVCTYIGMDSLLRLRYMKMTDSLDAEVSPAGAVWRYIRAAHPSINLYIADESHPSAEGSFAAACSFYASLFRKNPEQATFNFTISAANAASIKTAAKKVVFDSLSYWQIGKHSFSLNFSHTKNGNQVSFTNTSTNATGYKWDFGDGQTSTQAAPSHTYTTAGTYKVTLTANSTTLSNCKDTLYDTVNLLSAGVNGVNIRESFLLYPNPANDVLNINSVDFLHQAYTIHLSNSMGQVLQSYQSSKEQTQQVNLSGLGNGVYFISVAGADGNINRYKFIKQ